MAYVMNFIEYMICSIASCMLNLHSELLFITPDSDTLLNTLAIHATSTRNEADILLSYWLSATFLNVICVGTMQPIYSPTHNILLNAV